MRPLAILLGLTLLVPTPALFAAEGAAPAPPPTRAALAFDSLKSLAGQWQGKNTRGEPATLSIAVGAGGHAVLDDYRSGPKGQMSMYTVYHLDGEHLMLTHYCVSQNQPRMRARFTDDPNVIHFDFLDATNLTNPKAGHMYKAEIHFVDADKFWSIWSYRADGKELFAETTHWERVAAPATAPSP